MNDIGCLFRPDLNEKDTRCLLLLIALLAVAVTACGKKGPPLPPLLRQPAAVGNATAMRVGDDVFIQFSVPTANADGHTPADVGKVELYAVTADRAPTPSDRLRELRAVSTLIASEDVRRPLPPPPPAKPGEPEPPPPPPLPGVDQGATLVFHDVLTAESRVAVPLPNAPAERDRAPSVEPAVGPLVAPLEAAGPVRYYYAVGVSPSGRYGLVQAFLPVPLGVTSSAPSPPLLTYDEKTLTIKWNPPADARREPEPAAEGNLPARSLVPALPPTTYDVYEVPREDTAAANKSPSMPVALTPAPVGSLELTQPVTTFGIDRCFFIRAVDILNGFHVRGPASPQACVTLKDTFAPAAPKSLAAVAGAGTISLIWEPSEESDLAGYLVLRGEAPGATLTPLTPEPIAETTYPDRSVTPGTQYIYAVIAVDKAGNRSAESNRVEEMARQ